MVRVPECQFDRPVWVTAECRSEKAPEIPTLETRNSECSTWSGRTPVCTEPEMAHQECGWKCGERAALGHQNLNLKLRGQGTPLTPSPSALAPGLDEGPTPTATGSGAWGPPSRVPPWNEGRAHIKKVT